jgi:hypothetical protein
MYSPCIQLGDRLLFLEYAQTDRSCLNTALTDADATLDTSKRHRKEMKSNNIESKTPPSSSATTTTTSITDDMSNLTISRLAAGPGAVVWGPQLQLALSLQPPACMHWPSTHRGTYG